MITTTSLPADVRRCANNCTDCHVACVHTIDHCLRAGGAHAAADHIGLLLDCAAICAVSADAMLRNSPRHALFCAVCARVCVQCAEDCEQLGGGDEVMKACADACRACAESCAQMSHPASHPANRAADGRPTGSGNASDAHG